MWRAIVAVIVSGDLWFPAAASSQPLGHQEVVAVTISVHAAPKISPVIVNRALDEASAIWRPTGVTFQWLREDSTRAIATPPHPTRPRVIIDDSRGTPRDTAAPIGWVNFAGDEPDGDIHISHRNAEQFILAFGGVAGASRRVSPAERFVLVGRTLGRALAHEIGHYLLRSRHHSTTGLMRGRRTVKEFIDSDRRGFEVDAADREAAAGRIRQISAEAG